jgi:hypothetical protein
MTEKIIVRDLGARGPKGSGITTAVGLPNSTVGTNGDFYIDTASARLYGPKTNGAWNTTTFITLGGAAGKSFINGTIDPTSDIGSVGDTYLNTSTTYIWNKTNISTWTRGTKIVSPSAISFRFEQQTTVNTWDITHNLGFRPNVSVLDYGQNNIECDIEHVNENELQLHFSEATSGYAYLS